MSSAEPLSEKELDVCIQTLKNIENAGLAANNPGWLPTDINDIMIAMPRLNGKHVGDETDFRNCVNMITWIRTVRKTQKYGEGRWPWFPSRIDMWKSSFFWRLRSGKAPLPSPPPTSFSYPWYDVVENLNAHWIDSIHIMPKNELVGPDYMSQSYACINQDLYVIKKWVDAEETIPSVVEHGQYLFHVFRGTYETKQVTSMGVAPIILHGWYIQRLVQDEKPG